MKGINEGNFFAGDLARSIMDECIADNSRPSGFKLFDGISRGNPMVVSLLHHVAMANPIPAVKLLESQRRLLCIKGDVIDCCEFKQGSFFSPERRLINLTAFQYALWAKDTNMVRILSEYMTPQERFRQLEEFENEGVTVRVDGITYEHQYSYDLRPYKTALQRYVDKVQTFNLSECNEEWIQIGMLQRSLPRNLIQEYCYAGRPFFPLPTFKEVLARNSKFNDLILKKYQEWDDALSHGSSLVGVDFGLFRGENRETASGGFAGGMFGGEVAKQDLAAICCWENTRTAEIIELKMELMNPQVDTRANSGVGSCDSVFPTVNMRFS